MAVIIPMIAAASSMAAIAAGTATVMSYVAVAGAVMSTVGAINGNKKLQRFGSLLSLGAGLANLATGAANAASSAGDLAGAAGEAVAEGGLADAAMAGFDGAVSSGAEAAAATNGAVVDAATSAGSAGAYAGAAEAAGTTAAQEAAKEAVLAESGLKVTEEGAKGLSLAEGGLDKLSIADAVNGDMLSKVPGAEGLGGSSGALADAAGSVADGSDYGLMAREAGQQGSVYDTLMRGQDGALRTAASNPLTQGAQGLTWADIKSGLASTSKFMSDNKELVNMGGSIMRSVYGPEAEAADEQKAQFNRRLRNLNSPIRLGNIGVGG